MTSGSTPKAEHWVASLCPYRDRSVASRGRFGHVGVPVWCMHPVEQHQAELLSASGTKDLYLAETPCLGIVSSRYGPYFMPIGFLTSAVSSVGTSTSSSSASIIASSVARVWQSFTSSPLSLRYGISLEVSSAAREASHPASLTVSTTSWPSRVAIISWWSSIVASCWISRSHCRRNTPIRQWWKYSTINIITNHESEILQLFVCIFAAQIEFLCVASLYICVGVFFGGNDDAAHLLTHISSAYILYSASTGRWSRVWID